MATFGRVLTLTDCATTVVRFRAFVVTVHVPFDSRMVQLYVRFAFVPPPFPAPVAMRATTAVPPV